MVHDTLAPPSSAVKRMSWEPVANGSVVRLPSQPPRLFTRREHR
jgi:hypothetical protein